MKTLSLSDKKTIRDAVEFGKSHFIEHYVEKGYEEDYLQRVWHDLKKTSYARSLLGRSGMRYEATEAEIKKTYQDIGVSKKELEGQTDNVSRKALNGSRKDQVRELFESGVTKPSEIAKKLGTNGGYVSRILKDLGLR